MDDKPKQLSMTEICHNIAELLISKYNFKTIFGEKKDDIWIYDDGIYKPNGKVLIKSKVEQKLRSMCKSHNVNEVINKIARKTYILRENFECKNLDLICVKNGVLNLKTRKLVKHSPDYNFTNMIPIIYNKDAFCPKIFKFLSEILDDKDIKTIQEWFGYQLYREYFIKKAVILRGPPDTGKTAFVNLLIAFVGYKNISTQNLQLLAQGKWHVAKLYKQMANIGDDLNDDDVSNMGIIKQLTGRSSVPGEIKFGDSFSFVSYAKLLFACNKIPRIDGDVDDRAFWDRWMIFDFDNVFEKDDKDTNPHLIHEITEDNEMSGLLNWALDGLDKLRDSGYFSYKRSWEENKGIMQGESNSIARFVNSCLINKFGEWVSNKVIYDSYIEFCRLNDITNIETDRKFARDLRIFCNYGKFNSNKNNVFGVRNVKIKDVFPIGDF